MENAFSWNFEKNRLRTATPTELHPDFRIEAIPPLYICIYKTVLRKVPLPCFPHFQEIIKRDAANNWLGFITKAADILA